MNEKAILKLDFLPKTCGKCPLFDKNNMSCILRGGNSPADLKHYKNTELRPPFCSLEARSDVLRTEHFNLDDYSWKEINEIGKQGRARVLFGTNATKTVTLKNGEVTVFQIIGYEHDVNRNGETIAMTWELVGLLGYQQHMNQGWTNKGGWGKSQLRRYLNGDILDLLPNDLQEVIKPVVKQNRVPESNKIVTTTDVLWLLSEQEKYGRKFFSYGGEGKQYEYYKQENTPYHKLDRHGDKRWHWLRSPVAGLTTGFCAVSTNGNASWGLAGNAGSVSFGLCI